MPVEAVALTIVPDTFEQLVAEFNISAPLQSSFEGGGGGFVRHISNFGVCPFPDGSLPTLETLI
jgi:hypothetical protein